MKNMKNKTLLAGIGLVVLLLVIFFLFKSKNAEAPVSEANVVRSDDGLATMTIEPNALPDGVAVSDILITKVDNSQYYIGQEEGPLEYELSPDGLIFNDPVELRVELTAVDSTNFEAPFALHITGEGETKEVALAETALETEGEKTYAVVNIQHFSRVALWQVRGHFRGLVEPTNTEHLVGDSFDASYTVVPTGNTLRYNDDFGYDEFAYKPGSLWSFNGKISTSFADRILPWLQDANGREGLTNAQTHTVTGSFTCSKKGGERLGSAPNDDAFVVRYTVTQKSYSTFGGDNRLISELEHTHRAYPGVREAHTCTEPVPEEPPMQMEYVGPQYLIICPDGGPTLTGYYRYDANQQLLTDTFGNGLDRETGQPVVCPTE